MSGELSSKCQSMTERMWVIWQLAKAWGRRREMNLDPCEDVRPMTTAGGGGTGSECNGARSFADRATEAYV